VKHKKLIVIIATLVVMGIAATAAYAWFTSSGSLPGNSISTGNVGIEVQGANGPINVSGLMPSYGPAINLGTPWALSTQDLTSESNFPSSFFWIHNNGTAPEMFYAWAELGGNTEIANKVMCRIWLDPVDYPGYPNSAWWKSPATYAVWEGPLSDISTPGGGRDLVRSVTPGGVKETLPVGTYATYKIVFWLDSTADNNYQNKTLNVTLHVESGQEEAWPNF
jgi:hypothetical protein